MGWLGGGDTKWKRFREPLPFGVHLGRASNNIVFVGLGWGCGVGWGFGTGAEYITSGALAGVGARGVVSSLDIVLVGLGWVVGWVGALERELNMLQAGLWVGASGIVRSHKRTD